jgi:hypothetical protein
MQPKVMTLSNPIAEPALEPAAPQRRKLRNNILHVKSRALPPFAALVRWAEKCRQIELDFERRYGRPPRVE